MARPSYRSLADYLARSGDTQQGLAQAMGIAQAQVSRFASGVAMPRPELALRLATYCNFPLESFTHMFLARRAQKRGIA